MILVLPTVFGITLIGEGLNRIIHEEWSGIISVIFGLIFIGIVIVAYVFYSTYVNGNT